MSALCAANMCNECEEVKDRLDIHMQIRVYSWMANMEQAQFAHGASVLLVH